MKVTVLPFSKLSLYFYSAGALLLAFSWIDQWLELYLVSDIVRIQMFIMAIIVIAIAAIINLSLYIKNLYSPSKPLDSKSNPPSDH